MIPGPDAFGILLGGIPFGVTVLGGIPFVATKLGIIPF